MNFDFLNDAELEQSQPDKQTNTQGCQLVN